MSKLYTVGQVSKRTGLTVKALHHYDKLGLLKPAKNSAAGYRLYGQTDLMLLQQIVLFKQLGLSLKQIGLLLHSDSPPSLVDTLGERIESLAKELESNQHLLQKLENLRAMAMRSELSGHALDEKALFDTMEMMAMFEKYYSQESLKKLEDRKIKLGQEKIQQAENAWPVLIAKVQAAVDSGLDPASDEGAELARQWNDLIEMFTGGDPEIFNGLQSLYKNEPDAGKKVGLSPQMNQFIQKASR